MFWNMPKLSVPCVRAAKNDPPTSPRRLHRLSAPPCLSKDKQAYTRSRESKHCEQPHWGGGRNFSARSHQETFCVAAVNEQGAGWTTLGRMPLSRRCLHPSDITARKEHHRRTSAENQFTCSQRMQQQDWEGNASPLVIMGVLRRWAALWRRVWDTQPGSPACQLSIHVAAWSKGASHISSQAIPKCFTNK